MNIFSLPTKPLSLSQKKTLSPTKICRRRFQKNLPQITVDSTSNANDLPSYYVSLLSLTTTPKKYAPYRCWNHTENQNNHPQNFVDIAENHSITHCSTRLEPKAATTQWHGWGSLRDQAMVLRWSVYEWITPVEPKMTVTEMLRSHP